MCGDDCNEALLATRSWKSRRHRHHKDTFKHNTTHMQFYIPANYNHSLVNASIDSGIFFMRYVHAKVAFFPTFMYLETLAHSSLCLLLWALQPQLLYTFPPPWCVWPCVSGWPPVVNSGSPACHQSLPPHWALRPLPSHSALALLHTWMWWGMWERPYHCCLLCVCCVSMLVSVRKFDGVLL